MYISCIHSNYNFSKRVDFQRVSDETCLFFVFLKKNVAKYFTSRDGKEVRKLAYVSHKFATSMIRSFNLAFSDRLKQSDTKINTMTMMYNDVVQQITNLYLPYWSGTKPLDTLFRKGSGATEKLRNAVKGIKMTDDRGMQYYATLTFLSNVLQNINLKTTNNVYMLPYDMMNEDAIVEWAKHWVEAYNKPDISSSFKKNTEKKMLWNQVGDAVEEIACKK